MKVQETWREDEGIRRSIKTHSQNQTVDRVLTLAPLRLFLLIGYQPQSSDAPSSYLSDNHHPKKREIYTITFLHRRGSFFYYKPISSKALERDKKLWAPTRPHPGWLCISGRRDKAEREKPAACAYTGNDMSGKTRIWRLIEKISTVFSRLLKRDKYWWKSCLWLAESISPGRGNLRRAQM